MKRQLGGLDLLNGFVLEVVGYNRFVSLALVAQLDRASDFGSDGWGFESLRARYLNNENSNRLCDFILRYSL